MENFFSIPIDTLTTVLVVIFVLGAIALLFSALRNRVIFKMGARNLPRRPANTILTILGLMLAAAIFSASFSTGDTLTYSIRKMAVNDLGKVDIVVVREGVDPSAMTTNLEQITETAYFDDDYFEQVNQKLESEPEVEGVVPAIKESVPVVAPFSGLNEAPVDLLGLTPEYEKYFDKPINRQGEELKLEELGKDEVYISTGLSESLEAEIDSVINVYLGTDATELTVKGIYERGATPSGAMSMVIPLDQLKTLRGSDDINYILITNKGDSITGAEHTDAVMDVLQSEATGLQTIGLKAVPIKQDTLEIADEAGSGFTTVFLVFGSFSIIAGILLIFLILVMLAAERKRELGIARAVGAQRAHIIRLFTFEGALYALIASAIGTALGIAFGRGMIKVMSVAFEEMGFNIVYHFTTNSLIISYTLGVVLTLIVVIVSAWSVGRLNIVRAIRDIPDPPSEETEKLRSLLRQLFGFRRFVGFLPIIWLRPVNFVKYKASFYWIPVSLEGKSLFTRILLVVFLPKLPKLERRIKHAIIWLPLSGTIYGTIFLIIGLLVKQMAAYTLGASLAIIGLCLLTRLLRFPDRAAYTLAGLGLLIFWLMPFDWHPYSDEMSSGMEMFVLSGIFMVAGAVWVVMYNSDLLLSAITFIFGRIKVLVPVLKTAVSYPMANRFRTGMALAMFSLIIFTLVVMAVINASFDGVMQNTDRISGGFHIRSTVSRINFIPDIKAALNEPDGVGLDNFQAIASQNGTLVKISEEGKEQEWKDIYLTGVDADYTNSVTYGFEMTTEEYTSKSKDQVWKALTDNPLLAVVNTAMVPSRESGGGPVEDADFKIGEGEFYLEDEVLPDDVYIEIQNPYTGETQTLQVIGVVEVMAGPYASYVTTSQDMVNSIAGQVVPPSSYFFQVKPNLVDKVPDISVELEKQFQENGMNTFITAEEIGDYTELQGMFFDLMMVFMGLGLIVGIAALGVIAARSVVERRQQIGVLRALGFQRGMVQFSFLLESSFIALLGIGIGIALGLVLSIQLIPDVDIDGLETIIPWTRILLIVALAYGASLFTTYLPALQASRVYPAEALRYE